MQLHHQNCVSRRRKHEDEDDDDVQKEDQASGNQPNKKVKSELVRASCQCQYC
jgi:hypothetical protein